MSKCPKCEMSISRFRMEPTKAQRAGSTTLWNCVAYICPHCGTAISVQIDPTLLRDEIVRDITAELRRR